MEFRRATARDFPAIVRIQSENYVGNLALEERTQGFLSAQFTLGQLAALAADLGIMVAAEAGEVSGFLCGFRSQFDHGSPVIARMLETFATTPFEGKPLNAYRNYIYGPVCIDRRARGRGLLRGLYEAQKRDLGGGFDVGVAFVARDNPHSLRAHVAGLGMIEVGEFECGGNRYVTLAFALS